MLLVVLLAAFFCLSHALPMSSPMSSKPQEGGSTGKDRYAVLMEFSLKGTKNVRHETTPMQNADSNGNPMASKTAGTKNADGSTSFGCLDASGKTQPDGTEYDRPSGNFKYKCNNGNEEVVACVGSERTKKARIEVGQTLEVDGYWHKCQSFPNQSVVYTQESSCSFANKDYRVGDEINVGNLRVQCMDTGYKVVGCYYEDENKKVVSMNSGDQKEAGKTTHFCEDKGETLQYYTKRNGCTKAGKEYKEGEVFSQNHLRYKCANGMADVTGCYIKEDRDLGLGQDVVEEKMAYRCYRLGGKIEYSEYACGYNGTPSCTLEAIPDTPDDVPSLGRGLQAPGFGTISVVQQTGEHVAASPSNVKLELDKTMAGHH